MSNRFTKILSWLIITCLAFTLIALSCFITTAYAASEDQLKIEYEGNTKIVSNIQNFMHVPSKTRSVQTEDVKISYLLDELGVNSDIVPTYIIDKIKTASTVYSNEFFPTAVDQKFYLGDELSIIFMVLDDNEFYEGEHWYTLYAQAAWESAFPIVRRTDAICFEYTGGDVMGGYADYSMIYDRSSTNVVVSKNELSELNILPFFGVTFDLPNMFMTKPLSNTRNIGMFVTQRVSATGDFLANCSYAHSRVKVTPSIGVGITGSGPQASFNLTFGEGFDVYSPGLIRVNVK